MPHHPERVFDHPDNHPFDRHGNPAPACRMAERWLTYQQAGEALGMSPEAARQRARRLKWRTQRGNDGKALVLLPEVPAVQPRVRPPGQPPVQTAVQPPGQTGDGKALADAVTAFREVAARMQGDLDATRARADQAEREREEARVAAATLAAKLEAVEAAFAEMRAALEVARDDLAEARRPFWQRWFMR